MKAAFAAAALWVRIGGTAAGGYIVSMKVVSGRVVDGKVVPLGGHLEEGAIVTIVSEESTDAFEMSPELEAALVRSIEEADRGEVVSAEQVLAELRRP